MRQVAFAVPSLLATTLISALAFGAPDAGTKMVGAAKKSSSQGGKWMQKIESGGDLYATFKTTEGDVVVKLFPKDAPKTVANFVGLATGEKEWTDPKTHEKSNKPLYSGTIFHRVIPRFMVQGGDPIGTGTGDPGYRFEDEFSGPHQFDKPGILAMANAGPNTNGSQFFITVAPTPHLNRRHTIFGEVVSGYDTVVKISEAPRNGMDRPSKEVKINAVEISEQAPKGGK